VLAALGLESRIAGTAHRKALGNRSAWGSDALTATDFILHPFGHGWHLDRRAFDAALLAAAHETGARIVEGALRDVDGGGGTRRHMSRADGMAQCRGVGTHAAMSSGQRTRRTGFARPAFLFRPLRRRRRTARH
jgi:hypothetical protein